MQGAAEPALAQHDMLHHLTELLLCRNEPQVHLAEQLPNPEAWQGSELCVTILGNWPYYRAKILRCGAPPRLPCLPSACTTACVLGAAEVVVGLLPSIHVCQAFESRCIAPSLSEHLLTHHWSRPYARTYAAHTCSGAACEQPVGCSCRYLRQIAVITPYAEFAFRFKAEEEQGNSLTINFRRRSDKMPAPPQVEQTAIVCMKPAANAQAGHISSLHVSGLHASGCAVCMHADCNPSHVPGFTKSIAAGACAMVVVIRCQVAFQEMVSVAATPYYMPTCISSRIAAFLGLHHLPQAQAFGAGEQSTGPTE